jgi:hypothetical protein
MAGYKGLVWRNLFLGIDSWAPQTFTKLDPLLHCGGGTFFKDLVIVIIL